jgi:class 3 adenylate cyclase
MPFLRRVRRRPPKTQPPSSIAWRRQTNAPSRSIATHDPERMRGQQTLLDTLANLGDHRFEDGYRTMDVGSWLRSLGLGQYEAAFRDNAVDAEVLVELSDSDLAQLGVLLGHRKRLLKAIAELASADKIAPPTSLAPSTTAERRPITVMFCDLVGSTSLAAKLDAEDWRNLVNAYLDQASAAVTGFGGHVLKKLGDGLMALFGYPKAQESDAERAVRAALAIQRALGELNERNSARGAPELAARIGLESGLVVVDATGEVFGEAPNVAARVQAAAEPGSVLVTGSVQRQVAGLFVVEEKGARELKGVAQPLSLYRVVRASGGGRRGGMRALTQFIGREEELGLLARRWERSGRRRPTRAHCGRTGARQIEADRGVPHATCGNAAHLGRMERLAAFAEHAAPPNRRMGPTAVWCGCSCGTAPRRPRRHVAFDRP